ncbi:MAG: sugar transferase [Paracoccaceae bacterium]|nr:sugar transferase [Paracoccaceae bacterium]
MTDTVDVAARQGVGATHGISSAASSQTADAPLRVYRDFGKRALDVAAVIALAPLAVPLVALLSLLIALDGGAALFRQKRVGREGRIFTIVKLRTMVPDAERALHDLIRRDPDAAAEWKDRQKLRQDPRVTRLGAFLRRTSLDELPQLWNVLRGDMSLVGPRPMMPNQRSLYPGQAYYALRPGITGLWQVSDRNDNTFASRAGYDEVYAAELSFKLDVATLARTLVVVMRGTGC